MVIPRYDDSAVVAVELAREIARKRRELDTEEQERRAARQRGVKGRALPGRGNRQLTEDRRVCHGMTLALSCVIGYPGEYWVAEQFITEQEQQDQETEQ